MYFYGSKYKTTINGLWNECNNHVNNSMLAYQIQLTLMPVNIKNFPSADNVVSKNKLY